MLASSFATALLSAWVTLGDGLWAVDVGQGTALLVTSDAGDAVLIDSGPSEGAEAVLRALGDSRVRELSLVVHTHFDADHVGAATRILDGEDGVAGTPDDIVVREAWDRGTLEANPTIAVGAYLTRFRDVRTEVGPGARFWTPGLQLEVLSNPTPNLNAESGENNRGLALCVRVGERTIFVPGDRDVETLVDPAGACRPADVLVASHHGSSTGMSADLLAVLQPRVVLVSAGFDNPYCHPAPHVLALAGDRRMAVTAAAGLLPGGRCAPIATALGASTEVVGAGLYVDLSRGNWR